MDAILRPNQKWWAEHGHDWFDEYQRRRRSIPYYTIHEAFLSGYFSLAAPARVLEFGCGFCRHLNYLRKIPGLEVYGCDPSPTMLENGRNLIDGGYFSGHVRLIDALRPLPYEDKSFDIVFTASVLIHIHPDDVAMVIKDLVRVARWHVLHIENLPTDKPHLTCDAHDGCWAHPIERIYSELGVPVMKLPRYGSLQCVYRAVLDGGRPLPHADAISDRLFEVEASALQGMRDGQKMLAQAEASAAAAKAEVEKRLSELEQCRVQVGDLKRQVERNVAELNQARSAAVELRRQVEDERGKLEEAHGVAADLQRQLEQKCKDLSESRLLVADLQRQLERTRVERAALDQIVSDIRAYNQVLKDALAQRDTQIAAQAGLVARTRGELDAALRQCDAALRTEAAFHANLMRILERK